MIGRIVMIFAIDIGNTNIVIGCMEGDKISFIERMSTDVLKTELEYAVSFKTVMELYNIQAKDLGGSIISSVVPQLTSIIKSSLQKLTNIEPIVVGPGVKTGLNILLENPAQLGSDLVIGAVAGIHKYGAPLIIIDMGTATTISVIDEKKNFLGGPIIPGAIVSLNSLVTETSQLPRITLEPPKNVIGRSTIDSMKSGLIYGQASCLDGMIDRIEEELGQKAIVIATGGLAKVVIPCCKNKITLDDSLLLDGLKIIYEKNYVKAKE